jgi:hypothetical protein
MPNGALTRRSASHIVAKASCSLSVYYRWGSIVWINLDEAILIYARMLRSRFGAARGVRLAQESAKSMLARSDLHGAKVWEAVAAELRASDH